MPPPPTYRTGSSLPSSSSSPATSPSSPAQPIAPTTAFDRAKAFRERLESTRANTALRASTVQQPPPPPPPPPTGTVPSTLPPAPASLPTRPTLAALSASAAASAPTSQPQPSQPPARRPSPLARPFEPKATAAIVQRAREGQTGGGSEETPGAEGGQGKQSAQDEPAVYQPSSRPETFPIPSVAHTAPPPAPPGVPLHLYTSPSHSYTSSSPYPYPGYIPSSAYPISSLHPQAQSPMLAPMGTSVEAMVEHALGVVGVSREEWEDTARVEEALCRIWEKILPLPPSQLPPPLTSSVFYLLSTLLTPSSPSSAPRLTSPFLLRMVAYLTLVEKARDGGGAGGAGEWGRVYECLAEGWRGVLVREREGEGEESERRREEKRRDVEEENRELKEIIEQQQDQLDRLEALATDQITSNSEIANARERVVEAKNEADALRERVKQLEKERDEAVERERRRREEAKPSRRVALLLEDLDKSNSARATLQSQLDSALSDLAEARSALSAHSAKGGTEEREREVAEADRLILEGRLEGVEREKKELEERLKAEVERRKKAEEEVKTVCASVSPSTPTPSTTTPAANGAKEIDKLRAELRQNKFVIERLAGKVKELNKEVSDRRDENAELLSRLAAFDAA